MTRLSMPKKYLISLSAVSCEGGTLWYPVMKTEFNHVSYTLFIGTKLRLKVFSIVFLNVKLWQFNHLDFAVSENEL